MNSTADLNYRKVVPLQSWSNNSYSCKDFYDNFTAFENTHSNPAQILKKETCDMTVKELFDQWISRDKDPSLNSRNNLQNVQSQSHLVIFKNRINDFFSLIKTPCTDVAIKDRVFKYTRGNKISLIQMQELKRIIFQLNKEGIDRIDLRKFLIKIKKKNLIFPQDFLTNLINDIQIDENTISYQKFSLVMNVYLSLPIYRKGDCNNSEAFKNGQDLYGYNNIDLPDPLISLMKLIHIKIEEKYKGYMNAFRAFDVDFNGYIDFRELIGGLESMGILLDLENTK